MDAGLGVARRCVESRGATPAVYRILHGPRHCSNTMSSQAVDLLEARGMAYHCNDEGSQTLFRFSGNNDSSKLAESRRRAVARRANFFSCPFANFFERLSARLRITGYAPE